MHGHPGGFPFWFASAPAKPATVNEWADNGPIFSNRASFRSLGLVFAFSPHQRINFARDSGSRRACHVAKEVNGD
jgi:hypothetical protein